MKFKKSFFSVITLLMLFNILQAQNFESGKIKVRVIDDSGLPSSNSSNGELTFEKPELRPPTNPGYNTKYEPE